MLTASTSAEGRPSAGQIPGAFGGVQALGAQAGQTAVREARIRWLTDRNDWW